MKTIFEFMKSRNALNLAIGTFAITLILTNPSFAQNFSGVETFLETIKDAITGPIGISISALAVMGVGFSFMMGHMDWSYAAAVILGIAVVFGGATFVDSLTAF